MLNDLEDFFPPEPCGREHIIRCLQEARRLFVVHCESSIVLAQSALQAADTLKATDLEIEALLLIGQSQQIIQHTDTAVHSFTLALEKSKLVHDTRQQSQCHEGLALCYQSQRQTQKALHSWLNSLELATQENQIERYIHCYLGIGDLYFQRDHFEQAFYFQSQAVEWAQLHQDIDLQSRTQLHLAATLIRIQDYALAERLLLKTEDTLILPIRLSWLAEINHYLGQISLAKHDWIRAQAYFQAAYDLNLNTSSRWGQTQCLISLGQLACQQAEHEKAIVHLQQALELAEALENEHLQQQIHRALSSNYEACGDFIRATMHHIGFHNYYLQLQKQNTRDQLDAISTRRLNQAEIKLQLLRSELEVKQLMQQRSLEHERMQQLENAAYHDALTGVLNRHALDEQLPLLLQQIRQEKNKLCLIMIDFDHFKQVNDLHSHQIGDEVLKQGSKILLQLTRETDLLARFGGEEFVLVLPRNDASIALRIAERMRQEIARHDWDKVSTGLQVTISLGCAQWQPAMSIDELMAAADQALYQAKHQGRNQVCLYQGPEQ
ncbi:GGDEF domain-containing protein [Chitinibacter fontanus]|uniref:diguanylate cyclase n=1 Tax=Chitinibacter fontanus TaxID=1737446 RepID=A0A7D5Z769_9NEIS|nr:GGDEF domain-containing protein [Chitinibacter fontanus]QLI81582.1 GGDEF domain-containing protein [Chitinibacter fontanus]